MYGRTNSKYHGTLIFYLDTYENLPYMSVSFICLINKNILTTCYLKINATIKEIKIQ